MSKCQSNEYLEVGRFIRQSGRIPNNFWIVSPYLDPAIWFVVAICIVILICKCALMRYDYEQSQLGRTPEDSGEHEMFRLSELEAQGIEIHE